MKPVRHDKPLATHRYPDGSVAIVVRCRFCSGTGEIPETQARCRVCKGAGRTVLKFGSKEANTDDGN